MTQIWGVCTLAEEFVKKEDALKNYNVSDYKTPDGYTSDIAIFTISPKDDHSQEQVLKLLLIKRAMKNAEDEPNMEGGKWALPGGFIDAYKKETAMMAAERELKEETGIDGIFLKHFGVYDEIDRDPRGWIISNAHYAVVNEKYLIHRKASDDAQEVELFSIDDVFSLPLAFDHERIIKDAYEMIKEDMIQTTVAKEFLPEEFTLSELWHVIVSVASHDAIETNANFHRKARNLKFIEEALDEDGNVKTAKRFSKKPTKLYRFNDVKVLKSIYR